MARQLRIQYPGAIYHIMARGDRQEPIVRNDGDRRALLRTLEDMCERTGIQVYAYALLDNHYHLVLVTPEGNLVKGMSWLQNTYTRRFNTCHHLWGHLFGDRYKSVLVDPEGNYFRRVIDYVHLNPVRAGLISADRIGRYPWGSLKLLLGSPVNRPRWLAAEGVLSAFNLDDTSAGRMTYRRRLETIIEKEGPRKAGRVDVRINSPDSLQATIRRGWYFGSQEFKERLLPMLDEASKHPQSRGADGYYGEQLRDHDERRARVIIQEGCTFFGTDPMALRSRKRNDPEKVLLGEVIASQTSVKLDWIRNELGLGARGYASRLINQMRRNISSDPRLQNRRDQLLENVNI